MTVESSKSPVAATPKTTIASAADSGADSGGDDVELKGQVCKLICQRNVSLQTYKRFLSLVHDFSALGTPNATLDGAPS